MRPLSLPLLFGDRLVRPLPVLVRLPLLLLLLRRWTGIRQLRGSGGGRFGRRAFRLFLLALVFATQRFGFQLVPVAVEVLESIVWLVIK